MNTRPRYAWLLITNAVWCALCLSASAGLPDEKGQIHERSQYKGNIVVLEWVNFACPFVKKHYGSGRMQELQAKYTGKGVVWLTVQSTAPGRRGHHTAEALVARRDSNKSAATAILLDEKAEWARAFKISKVPSVVILDATQKVVYEGAVDDTPGFLKQESLKATNYIEQALDRMLAGKPLPARKRPPYGCSLKLANP